MDIKHQLEQLERVRELAKVQDPAKVLPKVLETGLSLYKQNKERPHELSRFCSRLYCEVVRCEQIPSSERPFVAAQHLHGVVEMCQGATVDHITYQNVLLGVGSVYDGLFDLVAKTSNEGLWKDLVWLKEQVESRWKTCWPLEASEDALADHSRGIGVRLASVKLLTKMVIVHTQGSGVNIGVVPDNHPVIRNKQALQSESKRLLDVVLGYLIEEPMMVAQVFCAILYCLAFVMKQRPMANLRILSGLLRFNIDLKYQQDKESALQYRLAKRFVERTYKNFVNFGIKKQLIKNSGNIAPYHSKLVKIAQTLHMIAEETKSKGILNFEPATVERRLDAREREKYIEQNQQPSQSLSKLPTPLPALGASAASSADAPAPAELATDLATLVHLQNYTMAKTSISNFFNNSPVAFNNDYASVYSLMNSKNSGIDVSTLSQSTLVHLCTEAICHTDTNRIIAGLSIVASRYTDLMNKAQPHNNTRSDDDDPNPPKRSKLEDTSASDDSDTPEEEAHEFFLPTPLPLSHEAKLSHLDSIVQHLFEIPTSNEVPTLTPPENMHPFQRTRMLQWDNNASWLVLLTRLCARGLLADLTMADRVRQHLYDHFLQDFSNRVSVVIDWLSEEWFAASIRQDPQHIYNHWSLRVLDGLVPFLEGAHRKLFIRLLSELPHLDTEHIARCRSLCFDPLRSSLGFQALKFLIMFRPPVRSIVKDLLDEMKREDGQVKDQCESILAKFY